METTPQEMAVTSQEAYLLSIMHSLWKNRCIGVVSDLKIPELLCNTEKPSMSIEEIAAKSGCQTSTQLYAVMRLLTRWGIGKEIENKHFAKNESMELLRRDKGPSLGHYINYHTSDEHFSALRSLGASVKEGKPTFLLDHGMDHHYTYMYDLEKSYEQTKMFEGSSEHKIGSDERRKEFAENFSGAMTKFSNLVSLANKVDVKTVYNVFPWSTCQKLVDVGGSLGGFLASVLKLPGCEHIQGYVLELPDVVKEAKSKIEDLGIPERRIEFFDFDFTKPFPSDLDLQADTVMFKNTLSLYVSNHGLMRTILSNCRNIFSSKGGRILIIDAIVRAEDNDNKVGINGIEFEALSIHWLSISEIRLLTKEEWMKHLKMVGEELGYEMKEFYDTFAGGHVIFELSYKPIN